MPIFRELNEVTIPKEWTCQQVSTVERGLRVLLTRMVWAWIGCHALISGAICEALKIFGQKIKAIFLDRHLSGQISFFLIICMCNNCLRVISAEGR